MAVWWGKAWWRGMVLWQGLGRCRVEKEGGLSPQHLCTVSEPWCLLLCIWLLAGIVSAHIVACFMDMNLVGVLMFALVFTFGSPSHLDWHPHLDGCLCLCLSLCLGDVHDCGHNVGGGSWGWATNSNGGEEERGMGDVWHHTCWRLNSSTENKVKKWIKNGKFLKNTSWRYFLVSTCFWAFFWVVFDVVFWLKNTIKNKLENTTVNYLNEPLKFPFSLGGERRGWGSDSEGVGEPGYEPDDRSSCMGHSRYNSTVMWGQKGHWNEYHLLSEA